MSASCFQTLSLHYLHLHLLFSSSFYFISRAVESYASKDGPLYTECNIPFTCGPQWPPRRNVTYPFWGNRRARHCGVDGFELGCQDDEYPFMEFNSQKYRVLDIDQVSRVMTLARNDLWEGPCIASPLLNTAMDNNTLFDYPKGVKNISIFYCPYHDPDDSPLKFPEGIDCKVPDKRAILIADDAVDRTILEYADLNQCDRIKVPVLEPPINETAPGQEKWEEVLRGGFNLTYRLDGGVCGSNSSYSSQNFTCCCSDKPYPCTCLHRGICPLLPLLVGITRHMPLYVSPAFIFPSCLSTLVTADIKKLTCRSLRVVMEFSSDLI